MRRFPTVSASTPPCAGSVWNTAGVFLPTRSTTTPRPRVEASVRPSALPGLQLRERRRAGERVEVTGCAVGGAVVVMHRSGAGRGRRSPALPPEGADPVVRVGAREHDAYRPHLTPTRRAGRPETHDTDPDGWRRPRGANGNHRDSQHGNSSETTHPPSLERRSWTPDRRSAESHLSIAGAAA